MAEPVTVVREPKRDTFGNKPAGAILTWVVEGWDFAPGRSEEYSAGANAVDTDATLYGPAVSVINDTVPGGIKATDKIQVRGDDYQVVGRVQDWGADGSVILLRFVTG